MSETPKSVPDSPKPKSDPDRIERLAETLRVLHETSERLVQNKNRLQVDKQRLHQLNLMMESGDAHEWYLQEMGTIVREMEQNRRAYTALCEQLKHLDTLENFNKK